MIKRQIKQLNPNKLYIFILKPVTSHTISEFKSSFIPKKNGCASAFYNYSFVNKFVTH